MAAEARFRAMGSDAHVIVVGDADLIATARRRIEQLESRWSRFRPDSEVCELTRRAGAAVDVSADTRLLVQRSIDAWWMSGGAFDPTVLGAVIRAGYDRSFDAMPPETPAGASVLLIGCTDIEIEGTTVRLPARTGFDPGGIGKGLAADLVVSELLAAGADGACVNLGGDLRVAGEGPAGDGWTCAIEHQWSAGPLVHVGVADGGVATSTTLRRSWLVDGETRHHLIDPLTGLSSTTDLTAATVIAGEAWQAEVLAKAVLLRGSLHPFDLIEGSGAVALIVDDLGRVRASDGFAAFHRGWDLVEYVEEAA
jgi:thiamine biosynthesis lipoprotein